MKNKDAFQVEAAPGELSPSEQSYRNMVIPYLLTRAYHIPGNSWFQVCSNQSSVRWVMNL